MGASILVDHGAVIALSSIQFDHVVEGARQRFREPDHAARDEIYLPLDEGAMPFVSLKEQDSAGFNAFLDAAVEAYEAEIATDPDTAYRHAWELVISQLRQDSRARKR